MTLSFPSGVCASRPSEAKQNVIKALRRDADVMTWFVSKPQIAVPPSSKHPIWITSPSPWRDTIYASSVFNALFTHQRERDPERFHENVLALSRHPSGVLCILGQLAQNTLLWDATVDQYTPTRALIRETLLKTLIDSWQEYVALGARFGFSGISLSCLWRGTSNLQRVVAALGFAPEQEVRWHWLDQYSFLWTMQETLAGRPPSDDDVRDFHKGVKPDLSGTRGVPIHKLVS